jgi:hypothetical protein
VETLVSRHFIHARKDFFATKCSCFESSLLSSYSENGSCLAACLMRCPLLGNQGSAYNDCNWAQSCQEPHRFNGRFQDIANRR